MPGTDFPVPGDYDGDGDADIAVYRYTTGSGSPGGFARDDPVRRGRWRRTGAGRLQRRRQDRHSHLPHVHRPVVRPGRIAGSEQYGTTVCCTDVPAPADYDGNGAADKAVFRETTGQFLVLGGAPEVTQYGAGGYVPLAMDVALRWRYGNA